jgi:hypothetical protein
MVKSMTDTKPTPGPYKRDGRTVYALQPSGERRVPLINRWAAHVQVAPGTPEAEAEAVAQLFEAAPELVEALTSADAELERIAAIVSDEDGDLIEAVREKVAEALRKAGR